MAECPSNNSSAGDGALTQYILQKAMSLMNIKDQETLSTEDKCELLADRIMKSNDMIIIYDIMDLLNISCEGAATIEETKERIKIRLMPAQPETNKEILNLINMKQEFDKSKQELNSLYEDYIEILNTNFPAMKDRLTSEDIISDVATSIHETQETLQNAQCTIIVTGETGAGKSTLLNLILNDMVLPHHAISCTSTICMIKYGEKRHMKVIYFSGKVNEFDIEDDEESKSKIKDAMFRKSGREMGSDIRSVELQLPSDILKCGLVLVDSPGIGENEAMEEILTKFIKENQIQGFMYVIKVDGASCGIQEDRILKLMKIVIEKQNSSNSNATETCLYDGETTFFILNRWDLVSEEEQPKVRDYIEKRLNKCCPGIDASEILFMSATSDIRQLENGFVSKSYVDLIKGIKQMMRKTTFIILKRFYRWLNYMVSRSLHHFKTLFSGVDLSEYKLKQKFCETEEKMNILEKSSGEIFAKLREDINNEEDKLNKLLIEYLRSEELLNQIMNFSGTEIEFMMNSFSCDEVICDMVGTKIIDAISEYTVIDEDINRLKDSLLKTIKKKTFLLQEELSMIESQMVSEMPNTHDLYHCNRRVSNFSVCSWQLPIAPPKIPSSVMGRLAISAKNLLKRKHSKQFKDKRKQIKTSCEEEIQNFIVENDYVSCQLQPIRRYLEIVEMSIPKLIESNKTLVTELAENHSNHILAKEAYIRALNKIMQLQDKIARFGYGNNFNQKNYIENSIHINESGSSTLSRNSVVDSGIVVDSNRRAPRSLFSEMVHASSRDEEITIRKYINHVQIPNIYVEIEKLTYLHHESVAKFLQTLSDNESVPVILFDERLFSLRCRTNQIKQRSMIPTDRYPMFIQNIVSGLVYIHSNGLTHPEVSLDSVMINWHHQVKLIGMALPRSITILDLDQPIQDLMYLAPEVLRGKVYESPADVFGLGLLICELFIKKRVFVNESKLSIGKFRETVDTSVVEYFDLVPFKYRELVSNMLKKQANERITSNQIWRHLIDT